MKSNKYDIFLIVLIFVLAFGLYGGALTVARLLAIIFIPILLGKSKRCVYIKPLVSFFSIFYIFCLVSMIWTPDKIQGLKELAYYPIHFLYFLEIIVFAKYANNPLRSIAWGWTWMIAACSVVACWELVTDNHLWMALQEEGEMSNLGSSIVRHLTASVTFGNYNSYVTELCYAFPWLIYMALQHEKGFLRNSVLWFAITMSIVVILFNMSRGGLLSFIIMGVVYFILSDKSLGKSIITLLVVIMALYFLYNYGQDVLAIIEARTSEGGMTHDDARISIWTVSLRVLSDYLFVGVGIGGITEALSAASNDIVASPHSLIFEFLVQYGILFTAFLLFKFFKMYVKTWRIGDSNRRMTLMMSLFAFPAFTIIDSGYLLDPDLFALFGTIYVFIYYEKIHKEIICRTLKSV